MNKICEHLKPILDYELNRGNIIEDVSNWSLALVFYLKYPMNISEIKKLPLDQCVTQVKEQSPHYMIAGFHCNKCKQGVAGPLN